MEPLNIIKLKISRQIGVSLPDGLIAMKVYLFILYCPPQPLHKYVIIYPPVAIHADPDVGNNKTVPKTNNGGTHQKQKGALACHRRDGLLSIARMAMFILACYAYPFLSFTPKGPPFEG